MNTRALAVAAALAAAVGAGATAASAAPITRLPDADLFCPAATMGPTEWVALGSGTLWITAGDLAGHYVVLEQTHYFSPGLMEAAPATYEGLQPIIPTERFGRKAALVGDSFTCDFVSRWDLPGEGDDFSVFGPVTIAKVSG